MLDLTNPEAIKQELLPEKFTWKWFKRKLKLTKVKKRLLLLYFLFIATTSSIKSFSSRRLLATKRFLISVSIGIEVLYELFACAFIWLIDNDDWHLIKRTRMLRQSLIAGIVITLLIIWKIDLANPSYPAAGFLIYQFVRLLFFLGGVDLPETNPEKVKGNQYSVKTYNDLQEEYEDEEPDTQAIRLQR